MRNHVAITVQGPGKVTAVKIDVYATALELREVAQYLLNLANGETSSVFVGAPLVIGEINFKREVDA